MSKTITYQQWIAQQEERVREIEAIDKLNQITRIAGFEFKRVKGDKVVMIEKQEGEPGHE